MVCWGHRRTVSKKLDNIACTTSEKVRSKINKQNKTVSALAVTRDGMTVVDITVKTENYEVQTGDSSPVYYR